MSLILVTGKKTQIESAVNALETHVKSQFKVALLQLPRNVRSMKVEDFYYDSNVDDFGHELNVECAKVAVSVNNTVSDVVKTTVKKGGGKRSGKKQSSILAEGPSQPTRKSNRKRNNGTSSWISEPPLASSTLTAAALGGFSTAKPTRTKGRIPQTPIHGQGFGGAIITPKFDPATPLNKTTTRTKRMDEKFLISMNGSPVYVGARGGTKPKENMIPLPIGDGKTLMVPADNPDVQPLLKKIINKCLTSMTTDK